MQAKGGGGAARHTPGAVAATPFFMRRSLGFFALLIVIHLFEVGIDNGFLGRRGIGRRGISRRILA